MSDSLRTGCKRTLPILAALVLAMPALSAPVAKIHTREEGAHRVRFEDLAPHVRRGGPWPTAALGLTESGRSVPIWIDDGGDGVFGEGDSFEFVARILPGTHGRYHEFSPSNVHLLSIDAAAPARMKAGAIARRPSLPEAARRDYRGTLHLEVDTLLMRFGCRREDSHELWYWHKLGSVDPDGFRHEFDLPDLDPRTGETARLELDLHGWSQLYRKAPEVRDHRLEIWLNERLLRTEDWDGKATHSIVIDDLDPALLIAGRNTIRLHVPSRNDTEGQLIPDAVVLNWIRLGYPRSARIDGRAQARLKLPPRAPAASAALTGNLPLTLYSANGTRFELAGAEGGGGWVEFPERRRFWAVPAGTLHAPEAVTPFQGARLAALETGADYIAIAHPRLRDAVRPLLDYRREQGLRVEEVGLDEVYDAFNHGIPHPRAIREFLRRAHESWTRPAPRFVLLVGDASWDSKHEQPMLENYAFKTEPLQNHGVGRAEGSAYLDASRNDRGLVPTWTYFSHTGHAASDNGFVSFDDDPVPEMAIGRFPVVTPQEVADLAAKTIAHERAADDGWRESTLWITNEQPGFQDYSDRLALDYSQHGYTTHKVYPQTGESGSTERILESLDNGQYLVYFYGHGGRYIWRTSPMDLEENRDLFSLDDVDRLEPTERTPIVMSFTCYSAPFDHPSEDSIGEKLVRVGGRGAVAVIASSWRNAPSLTMQQHYMDALQEASTIGEALVEAKRRVRTPELTETYNLLGDPALTLRHPRRAAKRSQPAP